MKFNNEVKQIERNFDTDVQSDNLKDIFKTIASDLHRKYDLYDPSVPLSTIKQELIARLEQATLSKENLAYYRSEIEGLDDIIRLQIFLGQEVAGI
jgi:hypothetical protein|tara:strand:+ start:43 stop:330 length:288 start_codon:yes stop_codon:yes gene_type:complete